MKKGWVIFMAIENKPNDENVHTYDNGFHPKEVILDENYKFYNRNFFFRLWSKIVIYFTRTWLIFPRMFMGVKIKGRKNKRKADGAIMVANHIHPLDAFFLAGSLYFKKVYVTMLQSNLGFGLFSRYLRIVACVPIPTDRRLLRKFNNETAEILQKHCNVLFFAEAALNPYCDHIRPFLPGAFHYAVVNDRPIMPCCFTFHKPKGLLKLFRKKPCIHVNYLEPYYVKNTGNRKEDIERTTAEVHQIINDFFVANSDYYYKDGKKIN